MNKVAVVLLSDAKSGSDEAVGRLFNALAAVYDFKQRGDDVTLVFQGAGSRWAGELVNQEHPAYELFNSVKDKIAGVSCGCAEVFGATDGAEQCGLDLIRDNRVPNTSGIASIAKFNADGYSVITF